LIDYSAIIFNHTQNIKPIKTYSSRDKHAKQAAKKQSKHTQQSTSNN